MTQTTFYQLNQWSAEDRIMRLDFNDDNGKIDAALHALDGRASQLDGKIAAERTYCNNAIAGVNSSIHNHTHWTKISDQGIPALSNGSFSVSLPGISSYSMINIELELKGSGRYRCSTNPSSASTTVSIIGDMNGNSSGAIAVVQAGGIAHILLFPAGSSSTPVSALAFSFATVSVGQSDSGALTFGAVSSLTFTSDNGAVGDGARVRIYGMR